MPLDFGCGGGSGIARVLVLRQGGIGGIAFVLTPGVKVMPGVKSMTVGPLRGGGASRAAATNIVMNLVRASEETDELPYPALLPDELEGAIRLGIGGHVEEASRAAAASWRAFRSAAAFSFAALSAAAFSSADLSAAAFSFAALCCLFFCSWRSFDRRRFGIFRTRCCGFFDLFPLPLPFSSGIFEPLLPPLQWLACFGMFSLFQVSDPLLPFLASSGSFAPIPLASIVILRSGTLGTGTLGTGALGTGTGIRHRCSNAFGNALYPFGFHLVGCSW